MDINKTKAKRGPKKGTKNAKTHTNNEWAVCCKAFLDGPKMAQKAFLQSDLSGPNFTGTASEIVTFSTKLKAFERRQTPGSHCRPQAQIRRKGQGIGS